MERPLAGSGRTVLVQGFLDPRRLGRLSAALLCLCSAVVQAGEWSGQIGGEYRGFFETPLFPEQHDSYLSAFAQPEYRHVWDNDRQRIALVVFGRVSQYDEARTHADIRELSWQKSSDGYEWRVGIHKVFWGVTESQHLVDIINQTDLVENPDGEDKLGQPMINLALVREWGTLDFFVLTGFRERTFPGREGRLRMLPPVDTQQAVYESSRGLWRTDYALRWHQTLGDWEVGLAHFSGTSREPRLLPGVGGDGAPALIPHYDVIDQSSLDVQMTQGAWLWKLETIRRAGQAPTYAALTAGFEYTLTGVLDSGIDLGLLAEYLYDDRGINATTVFQDDVFAGVRLSFNDVSSSEVLFGIYADRDSDAHIVNLEANRRLGKSTRLTLEARWFNDIPATDPLYSQHHDDYVQMELAYYF